MEMSETKPFENSKRRRDEALAELCKMENWPHLMILCYDSTDKMSEDDKMRVVNLVMIYAAHSVIVKNGEAAARKTDG